MLTILEVPLVTSSTKLDFSSLSSVGSAKVMATAALIVQLLLDLGQTNPASRSGTTMPPRELRPILKVTLTKLMKDLKVWSIRFLRVS